MVEDTAHLRILIADELGSRLDEIAEVVDGLGHTVVARVLDVSRIAEETRRNHPDVAIVGLGDESEHALALISEIVRQAACPVIADLETEDSVFVDNAARRGIFAYVKHGRPPDMANAIDIVLQRYAEFSRLEGAFGRRALIEQAKGILMERHGITADEAFEELRSRARSTSTSVVEVAEAVTLSHPLLRARQAPDES
ncbi:MAG TPA: ANTAR domain-containing protein [Solirubrobacteraceae bacterium]